MRKQRTFRFERLESRQLLAGNVTVQVITNGITGLDDLVITGDAESNQIAVFPNGMNIEISGTLTTVNGGGSALVPAADVTGDVRVDLGAGNDNAEINSVDVPRTLEVRDAGGDEYFSIFSVSTGDSLDVDLGPGANNLQLSNLQVDGVLNAFTGKLRIAGGSGADNVSAVNITVEDYVVANLGGGANMFFVSDFDCAYLNYFGGTGADDVRLEQGTISNFVNVKPGDGDNQIEVIDTSIANQLNLLGGAGVDDVQIAGVTGLANRLNLVLGPGNDLVNIGAGTLNANTQVGGYVEIRGGAGDDSVTLAELSASGVVRIIAGYGANSFTSTGGLYVAGNLTYFGGSENDTVTITGGIVNAIASLSMAGGTNVSRVSGLDAGGDINVFGTTGLDTICLTGVTSDAALDIRSGSGGDSIAISQANVNRILADLGNGSDDIGITDVAPLLIRIRHDLVGRMAAGIDAATAGTVLIEGGDANDQIFLGDLTTTGDVTINGGGGNDLLLVGSDIGGDLIVNGQAGNDWLLLEDAIIDATLMLNGDVGIDRFYARTTGIYAGGEALMGADDDEVKIESNVFFEIPDLTIDAGLGDDGVTDDTGLASVLNAERATDLVLSDFDFIRALALDLEARLEAACPAAP